MTPLLAGQAQDSRWQLTEDGGIRWDVKAGDAHHDQIEMSGKRVSLILDYGVTAKGTVELSRHVVFPALRTVPNDTHASLSYDFGADASPRIFINGRPALQMEKAREFYHRGLLRIQSSFDRSDVTLTRTIFPSTTLPVAVERYEFTNNGTRDVDVDVEETAKMVRTAADRGVTGRYLITSEVLNSGTHHLKPREHAGFALVFSARLESEPRIEVDPAREQLARTERVESFLAHLQLQTPDPVLNRAFAFAKIRTAESIYETKGGLMHGPGGGAYYAAIWANDQAEYADPFFPFLGDATANEAALNSFRLFARYMNPEFKPIPSSIIAEGTSFWNGAGDRGDMAMIAYGAGRFALAMGDRKTAEELWPLITWCLEYCKRKVTPDGVVASDSDELERRFPAGKANLCTSSLYYDALRSAAWLGRELKRPVAEIHDYEGRAEQIKAAINRYFGAKVQGFDTYRYYDGNTVLRAWIAIPLTMEIFERKAGTIEALFSPALWTADGLATQAGEKTFWDRATLYALRGVLAAGETTRAMEFLERYSTRRLLGEHVPYAVEAWPEGNQRHLAAESALYCRIYTEGLFGIRPTGLHAFHVTPRLPKDWDRMQLTGIAAFGHHFDLRVSRSGVGLHIEAIENGNVVLRQSMREDATLEIDLDQFVYRAAR